MITAFITNLKRGEITNKATCQRLNLPMNSFCKMKDGSYLSAGPNGLYEMGGSSDNGTPILAYFEPTTINLGIQNYKKFRYIIVEFIIESGGAIELIATTDNGDSVTKKIYSKNSGLQSVRFSISRSYKSVNWKFRIRNVNGCYFSISRILGIPIISQLGRSRIKSRNEFEAIINPPMFSAS